VTAARTPLPEAAATTPGGPPPLQLRVVPTPQPPELVLRGPLRLVVPGVAVPRPVHRPGPRPRGAVRRADADFGPVLSTRADLPDPRAAGRALLTTALEVLAGRRPATQLRPLTTPTLYEAVSAGRRPAWCAGGTAPILLGAVHVCEPVDGVAEVSAVARRGGRAHAVAARLEGIDGRWRCTAVQIG
jgi:Family of unknown function (DUF6459)